MSTPKPTNQSNCTHAAPGRTCPISKTPCMGECTFAVILDEISLGIVGIDLSRKEVFFQNKRAVDIFGDEIGPRDYPALVLFFLPDIETFKVVPGRSESRDRRIGNRFIGYTIYCISDMYLWIYVSDITEKMRLGSIAEAVNSMNSLGYIFSGIRHELGNPINAIKTTAAVLRQNLGTYSREMTAEYIDRILSDLNRVEVLLRDLKNFSLYETPDIKEVPIRQFLVDFVTMVRRDLERDGIRIRTLPGAGADRGLFDPRGLQQVMLNLVTNAAHSLKGREAPEIEISTFRAGRWVLLKVTDNGCGIPVDQVKYLFKPFYTTKAGGTGLGLVIVQKMMTKMNGTVDIESTEGVGTVVTLILPAGAGDGP